MDQSENVINMTSRIKTLLRNSALLVLAVGLILWAGHKFIEASSSSNSAADDVAVSLSSLPASLYVLTGAEFDTITFPNSTTMSVSIPDSSSFKLGNSSSNYLQISPSGSSAALTFINTDINSSGYITTWQMTPSGSLTANISLTVPEANKDYGVKVNGTVVTYAMSNSSAQINFSQSISAVSSFEIIRQDRPSSFAGILMAILWSNEQKKAREASTTPGSSGSSASVDPQVNDQGVGITKDQAAVIEEMIIKEAADLLSQDQAAELPSDSILEKIYKYLVRAWKSTTVESSIAVKNFLANGTPSTWRLGAGERGGVMNSFKEAFGREPASLADWQDILRIANGLYPKQRSLSAERNALASFQKIYGRNPDFSVINDAAAIRMMSYGLRPLNRDLEKEKIALKSFVILFQRTPSSGTDWDMVRAMGYAGVVR